MPKLQLLITRYYFEISRYNMDFKLTLGKCFVKWLVKDSINLIAPLFLKMYPDE